MTQSGMAVLADGKAEVKRLQCHHGPRERLSNLLWRKLMQGSFFSLVGRDSVRITGTK